MAVKADRRVKQPIVALAQDEDPQQLVQQVLSLLPLDRIVHVGDVVVIKPNRVSLRTFNRKALTKPEVLRAVIRAIKGLNPKRLMVAEGSGGAPTEEVLSFAGTDPVATDTVAAHLMGFKPQAVRHVWQAIADSLGEGRLERIEFRGLTFEQVAREFSRRVFGKEFVVK